MIKRIIGFVLIILLMGISFYYLLIYIWRPTCFHIDYYCRYKDLDRINITSWSLWWQWSFDKNSINVIRSEYWDMEDYLFDKLSKNELSFKFYDILVKLNDEKLVNYLFDEIKLNKNKYQNCNYIFNVVKYITINNYENKIFLCK